MNRLKLAIPFFLIAALLFWAVPAILKAVPDRYIMRLPEPIQSIGLPQNEVALLPTVEKPLEAGSLLENDITINDETNSVSPTPVSVTPTIESKTETQPTPTIFPSPTLPPTPSPTPWPLPQQARLEGLQHKFQDWNNCGPATLAMALTYFDLNVTQQETASILKPNPEDRNVSPSEMVDYVNAHTPFQAIYRANGQLETIRRLIANDMPVIVEVGIDPPGEFRWMGWYGHYLLIVAYDDQQQQFWVYDSWFGTSEEPLQNAHPQGRVVSYADLETYWPQFNRNYVVLFKPEQNAAMETIIGEDLDDQIMWEMALEKNKEALLREGDDPFLWFNLGTSYNAIGRYEQAATAFDQARAIGLPWRMLWYQFGPYEAYYQTGRYEDVVLLADVTLKDRPYFEESFYYKGLALEALGDTEGAQGEFRSAVKFNPNFQPAVDTLNQN